MRSENREPLASLVLVLTDVSTTISNTDLSDGRTYSCSLGGSSSGNPNTNDGIAGS